MKWLLSCAVAIIFFQQKVYAQQNLLLNGGFEDVNVCTEYNAECGVEAWFYLKDVKAQMLSNDNANTLLGSNSLGISFNWRYYTGFSPLIGTILPCSLQKGKEYIFKGLISAKLNPKLLLTPGVCMDQKFYVPFRPFSKEIHPDSIRQLTPIPNTTFYEFEYHFKATGLEKYLTFGTYIKEDTVAGKRQLTGTQTVQVTLDNFQLISTDSKEIACSGFDKIKKAIYAYNYRHHDMDNSLFGKGELKIDLNFPDEQKQTQIKEPVLIKIPQTDTIKLGDVLFDFNKSSLKPTANKMLSEYFNNHFNKAKVDRIYIEGHTDAIGADKRNLQLSSERSQTVKNWLIQNKIISGDAVKISGFGKSRPIATNKTPEGRALNRRVEIIIFRRQE